MKEATGELNMTVVTVVAIAAVGAFFYLFIWPSIQRGLTMNTCNNICPGGEALRVDNGMCVCKTDKGEITIDPDDWDSTSPDPATGGFIIPSNGYIAIVE